MMTRLWDDRLRLQRRSLLQWASVGACAWTHPVAHAQAPMSSDELFERRSFIEAATKEQQERLAEQVKELRRRGIHPLMVITTLRPFVDWDFFFVEGGSIEWRPDSGQGPAPVSVPPGFVTDLASIPRLFWQVLRPEGRHAYAAVVHDFLYWTQERSREEADLVFKLALQDSKVSGAVVETLYRAVRTFGQTAWERNARLRREGECRLLKRFPSDLMMTWADWKKQAGNCAPI